MQNIGLLDSITSYNGKLSRFDTPWKVNGFIVELSICCICLYMVLLPTMQIPLQIKQGHNIFDVEFETMIHEKNQSTIWPLAQTLTSRS
jgi:hypothetical protein